MSKTTQQAYTPMMSQYLEIKKDYSDYIVFFRLGDFYEMFFQDALVASKELEIVLTGRDAGSTERVPMCGVPYHAADLYIDRLIQKNYKVAVVEQVEDPKSAKTIVKREVVRIITPGTLMDQNSLEAKHNNYLVSIIDAKTSFLLGYVDLSTGETGLVNIPKDYELLADEVTNLNSREIIIKSDFLLSKLRPFLENYSCIYSIESNDIVPEWAKSLVQEIYQKEALQTIGLLIQYLTKTQRRELLHLQKVIQFDSKNYLRMDHNTIKNLELLETSRFQTRRGSLFELLDINQTAMGSRYLKQSLLRPLIDPLRLQDRYQLLHMFNEQFIIREEIISLLSNVYDLERIIGRISFNTANPKDLLHLAKSIKTFPMISRHLGDIPTSYARILANQIPDFTDLSLQIEKAIVDNPPLVITEGGIFQSGYDELLDQLKNGKDLNQSWLLDYEMKERERTGIKKLRVGYNRVFGYYIEVTRGQLDQVSSEFGYERKQTLSGSERFITPELKEKESLILGNEEEAIKREYELYVALRDSLKNYMDPLQKAAKVIAEIDMLCSFAKRSSELKYIRPTLHERKQIYLKHSRHPVVEHLLSTTQFIENDCDMDESTDIYLITGPNMAGKSTYMRQVALSIIMAQIGCFVPASEARLPIIDQIFTRIGASDDLSTGKSTFMVEMLEVQYALRNAPPNSLILFDEIGRGTATYDGMALAQAIIEYAHHQVKAKVLFSTHYHELTYLEDELKGLKNVHVLAREEQGNIVFLHKVIEGPTDRSYGIHVAKLAGMPKALLRRAEQILQSLEQNHGYHVIKPQSIDLFNFEDAYLVQEEHQNYQDIIDQMKEIDINELTPLKAMNILADLISEINKK